MSDNTAKKIQNAKIRELFKPKEDGYGARYTIDNEIGEWKAKSAEMAMVIAYVVDVLHVLNEKQVMINQAVLHVLNEKQVMINQEVNKRLEMKCGFKEAIFKVKDKMTKKD